MPLLTPSQVHIDQPLTNLTLAYVQSQENFIADKVFPLVGVERQSDKYYIYDRDNMNRKGDVHKPDAGLCTISRKLYRGQGVPVGWR